MGQLEAISTPRRRQLLAGVTATLLVAACASRGSTAAPPSLLPPVTEVAAAPSTTAAPVTTGAPPRGVFTGDPFFDPGDAPAAAPGTIIRSRPITTKLANAQVWQILYWSRTAEDQPVAVSGTVVAPVGDAAGTPRPVLAYAHGTTGLGDQCAPSAEIADGSAAELPLFPIALQQGWVVVETDYQGLGTPGDHPYLIGQSEGRNVLDSIRAAAALPGTGATPQSKAVVWGHSQGGGAAAFTAELRPTYAPDVDLVGAIAGAPPADLAGGSTATQSSYSGFVPMVVAGLSAGYPDLDTKDALTDAGRAAVAEVSGMCVADALRAFNGTDPSTLFAPGAADRPDWKADVAANRAGDRPTDVPIFLYHGANDDLVPPDMSARLLERYCAHGVVASRKVYPGTDHISVVQAAFGDIAAYALARIAGTPPPNDCG